MATTGILASSSVDDRPCPGCRYISCVPFPFFAENKWWHCDDCDLVSAKLYKIGDVYSKIDFTCPNDVVETIDILDDQYTDRDALGLKLPEFCRSYCDDQFN